MATQILAEFGESCKVRFNVYRERFENAKCQGTARDCFESFIRICNKCIYIEMKSNISTLNQSFMLQKVSTVILYEKDYRK